MASYFSYRELARLSSQHELRRHVPAEFEDMPPEELINQGIVRANVIFEKEHSSAFRQMPRPLEFPRRAVKYHGGKRGDPEPYDRDDGIAQEFIDMMKALYDRNL